jgi:hypothetical protein
MEVRYCFYAFIIIQHIIFFIGRMDIVVIQAKAQQYGFQTERLFK